MNTKTYHQKSAYLVLFTKSTYLLDRHNYHQKLLTQTGDWKKYRISKAQNMSWSTL